MDKPTQKQVWDAIAQDWRRFRESPKKEVQGFIEFCDGNMLDLGCGSGRHFIKKEGLKIYGVDFSERMIELAKENVSENKLNIELKLMSDEIIPYSDEFFDCLICIAVLHCVETKEKRRKLLEEIKRVLKKQGRAMIQVWSKNHKRVKNKGKEAMIPWTTNKNKFDRYYYIYDPEEIKNDLEDMGFKVERIEDGENIVVVIRKE